jgi:hypothetical protein
VQPTAGSDLVTAKRAPVTDGTHGPIVGAAVGAVGANDGGMVLPKTTRIVSTEISPVNEVPRVPVHRTVEVLLGRATYATRHAAADVVCCWPDRVHRTEQAPDAGHVETDSEPMVAPYMW